MSDRIRSQALRCLAHSALISLAVVVCPGGAGAALVGVTGAGAVWLINESTGALGRIGSTEHQGENALAVDSVGTVYSTVPISGEGQFLESIDLETGAGTLGAKLDPTISLRALAFSDADVLYGVDLGVLYRIDVATGAVTTIGQSANGSTVQGIDFGPDGLLYGMRSNGTLGRFNLTTGFFAVLQQFPNVSGVQSFEYLPNGRIVAGGTTLYELDPANGTTTVIGALGEFFSGFALVDLPDPPPPTPVSPQTAFRVTDLEFEGDAFSGFVTLGNVTYFPASHPDTGFELWRSDGTAFGTWVVKDIVPGPGGSSIQFLTSVNDTLFFHACEPTSGCELWKSDGTSAGTQLVKDIVPGSGSAVVEELTNLNGVLFFAGSTIEPPIRGRLYTSDGTAEGTQPIDKSLQSVPEPFDLTAAGGLLYFQVDNLFLDARQLWRSDGTPDGTIPIGQSGTQLTNVGGTLFFMGDVMELWKADGAPGGTQLVKDLHPEAFSFSLDAKNELTDVNGTLFFTLRGTVNSTFVNELWRSDGTPEGTEVVTNPVGWSPQFLAGVDDVLFLSASDAANGRELWKSDGTGGGTELLADIQPGAGDSNPSFLANVDGSLLFSACDEVGGCEPWITTPTYPGAVRASDVVAGASSSNPADFTRVGVLAMFRLRRNLGVSWELWAVPLSRLSLECGDGIDNDGDGLVDFGGSSADPGCFDASLGSTETPACQDGLDNDGDGMIDFDGGASANGGTPLAAPDPECTTSWRRTERRWACGLGAELALALQLLAMLRWRARRTIR